MAPITYQNAGVDPNKAAEILSEFGSFLKTRPRDLGLDATVGPYASSYLLGPKLKNYREPLLVTCCDGVGTKAKLALEWGDISGLGQDLVAMNVNDLICVGAEPLLFLDYYACGKLERDQLLTLLKGIQLACEASGCSLAGGETAEMPGVYQDKDFDLAGFAVGIGERAQALGPQKVAPGDVILGLSSSGVHSNGYSLVRKIVEKTKINPQAICPFDDKKTWAQVLLKPTTLYVSPLKAVMKDLHALAHITGGGLYENLPRVLPPKVSAKIDKRHWPFPPLFQWLQKEAALTDTQMFETFNCGVGMIAITSEKQAPQIQDHLLGQGIGCQPIGQVTAYEGASVVVG